MSSVSEDSGKAVRALYHEAEESLLEVIDLVNFLAEMLDRHGEIASEAVAGLRLTVRAIGDRAESIKAAFLSARGGA